MDVIQIDDQTTLRVEARAGMVLLGVQDPDKAGQIILSIDEAAALVAQVEHAIGEAYQQRRRQMAPEAT